MNRSTLLTVTSLVAAGSLLTACGSSSKSASTPATTSAAAAAATSAAPAAAATSAAPAAAATSATTAATSAAVATTGGASTAGAATTGIIGNDIPRADTPFWAAYIKYTPIEVKKLGITQYKQTASLNDVTKLIANVQTLLSEGAKAIVMSPQDTAAIAPTLASLSAKKIPVVSIDTRPDTGSLYMVVRANNVAYGTDACQFLGTKMGGKGTAVMLEGDVASINGRDRTNAFASCMKASFPGIKVDGEPSKWDGPTAANQLATVLESDSNVKGVYMESSFALPGTIQDLKAKGLLLPESNAKHVFVVSNDGIPEELKDIGAGIIDATVSQPADLYAYYGLYYAQAALEGKTFKPGPTDHNSTIIQVRPGLLEDEVIAPLVTADGGTYGGIKTLKSTDPSLWGNQSS